jgi:hypothetical protein
MEREKVLEMLVFSSVMMHLIAQEDLNVFILHESFKTCAAYVFKNTCLRDEEMHFSHGIWLQNNIHGDMKNWLYSSQALQNIKSAKISQKLQVTFSLQDIFLNLETLKRMT